MIKKLLAIFTVAIVGKELYFCILDKILHTTLFLAMVFVVCLWTGLKYKQEQDPLYNRISKGCAFVWVMCAIFTVVYAPKYFESAEPVSGGIGYVLVEIFDKDIAFISNSRDAHNIKAYDYYLVDEGKGKNALLKYFHKKVSPQVEYVEKGDAVFYYIAGQAHEEMAAVSVLEKGGYDILRVEGTKMFKQKNLLGGYYWGKNIYAQ
ncbi:hypothetical protein [Clostridium sp. AN503]|uniref:hypothetical protein n=1 Tax=Clostridium sp. AN503 TaxID=3160598 RepID=UPI00345AD33E